MPVNFSLFTGRGDTEAQEVCGLDGATVKDVLTPHYTISDNVVKNDSGAIQKVSVNGRKEELDYEIQDGDFISVLPSGMKGA